MRSVISAAFLAGAAAFLMGGSAQAALTVTADTSLAGVLPYGAPLSPGAINFDTDNLGTTTGGFSWVPNAPTGVVQILNGTSNIGAEPNGDTTNYLSILGNGSATLSSTTSTISGLELFVGSLDTYNTFTFHAGADVFSLTGAQILAQIPGAVSGSQGSPLTNFYLTFNFSENVDTIDFSSSVNSLEIDDLNQVGLTITRQGFVPEPSVWIVMIAGFGLLGMALRSRKIAGMVSA